MSQNDAANHVCVEQQIHGIMYTWMNTYRSQKITKNENSFLLMTCMVVVAAIIHDWLRGFLTSLVFVEK